MIPHSSTSLSSLARSTRAPGSSVGKAQRAADGIDRRGGDGSDQDLEGTLLATLPHLRAFAISLTSDVEKADDLVQDTVVRALSHIDKFEPGTNLQAWMFTILRNQFHTSYRKRRREVEDPDGQFSANLASLPEQASRLEFEDFRSALARLSPDQREAILLVGAEGFTYEETAQICRTKVGTIKSRVNRARSRLAEILGYSSVDEIGPDGLVQAAASCETVPVVTNLA